MHLVFLDVYLNIILNIYIVLLIGYILLIVHIMDSIYIYYLITKRIEH